MQHFMRHTIINNTVECEAKFQNADVNYGALYIDNASNEDFLSKFTDENVEESLRQAMAIIW